MVDEYKGDLFIFKLFLFRCVECGRRATEINHIVPRSRGPYYKEDFHNKVPMCNNCHDLFHKNGVTKEKIAHLKLKRKQFLGKIGKEEYI